MTLYTSVFLLIFVLSGALIIGLSYFQSLFVFVSKIEFEGTLPLYYLVYSTVCKHQKVHFSVVCIYCTRSTLLEFECNCQIEDLKIGLRDDSFYSFFTKQQGIAKKNKLGFLTNTAR